MRAQYLYRRSSGIYFVRLCVPTRLQEAVGKGEVHRSTGSRDLRLAKIVAAEIAAHWHRALEAVRRMDPAKIKAGSISLLGSGFIGLEKAANELGAEPHDLARRLADRGGRFFVDATGWKGWVLNSIEDDAEYEADELLQRVMVLPPGNGTPAAFDGRLRIRYVPEAIKAADGEAAICQFLIWPSDERGFVVDLPGQRVTSGQLQVSREDVEALRKALADELDTHTAEVPRDRTGPGAGMRFSELASEFLKRKGPHWKQDQLERKTHQCLAFQELMQDPSLAEISRPMVRQFSDEIARVPENRGQVRKRFGEREAGFRELIRLADVHDLPRLSVDARRRFMDGISEVFEWAVKETYMTTNPAKGLGEEIKKGSGIARVRDQDQRSAFSDSELAQIFGVEWFAQGAGRRTPQGRFHSYRPHYYWLPLLGILSGGRLNELSQLYLDDVRQENGIWVIDFNLNTPDKTNADEGDSGADKSLKTVNAQRLVPVHSKLIELGLLDYVDELRRAGHARLFPELLRDERKGYGKAAGSWFNERFLGNRLGIERDGRKTFHSLRHNFATSLSSAGVPTTIKSDLMGHSRSEALVESRYDKGAALATLRDYIDQIKPALPSITRFDVRAGLESVVHAQRLKNSHKTKQELS